MLFATYNIQYGVGQDGAFSLDRVTAAVRAADVVCFQEVAQHWERDGRVDQAAALAAALNYYAAFGTAFDVDASYVEAGGRVVNRRRTFGNMVASRWPIRSSRVQLLPREPLLTYGDVARCAVEAVVECPGGPLRVYSVHLSHTGSAQRLRQSAVLMEFIRRAPVAGGAWDLDADRNWAENQWDSRPPEPAIVMGDLNCTDRSPEYSLLAGEESERAGRLVPHDGLFDAWVLGGNREGAGHSLHGAHEDTFRIDHALVTPSLRGAVRRSWIDVAAAGSDHYPLFVELDLP